jgi:MFS transporter, DHA1 family, inner membrane transport protein
VTSEQRRARAVASSGQRTLRALGSPSASLFLAMFAAQAALLVLSPILPDIAADLDVSTATAAQLRSLSGLVAGGVAIWLAMWSRPRPLRDLLGTGLILLVAGSTMSAAAMSFTVLAIAQLGVGVGLGLVLSAALAAAGEWAPQRQGATLAWALAGQPVAWIVGMPVAGAVAEASWRYAWLAVPALASLVALAALAMRPRDTAVRTTADEPSLWAYRGTRAWALGELFAYGGWAGTLVFVGALLIDSYRTSTTAVGIVLAVVAAAYVPGNFLARRWVDRGVGLLLVVGGAVSAVGVAVLGIARPSLWFSAAVLAALAFVAGGRTLAGSSRGLSLAPSCRLGSMGVRTAAVQYGYLLGAAVGGAALASGGYRALGAALAALFAVSVVLHATALPGGLRREPAVSDAVRR